MPRSKKRKKAALKAAKAAIHRRTVGGNYKKLDENGDLAVYSGKRKIRLATEEERKLLKL